mmetsp:Transcript_6341/g.19144  ORF Transcript_6341/g.19144 Transcript_6341/m.19144 type:complete len:226 (-) Transcript_6341:547-1224(-)
MALHEAAERPAVVRLRLLRGRGCIVVDLPVPREVLVGQVAEGEGALAEVAPDLRPHHEILGLVLRVQLQGPGDQRLALLDLVGVVALQRAGGLHPTQVPQVEPRGAAAHPLLDLDGSLNVGDGLLAPPEAAHHPAEVAIHRLPELPGLVRLLRREPRAHDGLDLLQAQEGLLGARLLHAHGRHVVQSLQEPELAPLPAEGQNGLHDGSSLVHLVVLQVGAHDVER